MYKTQKYRFWHYHFWHYHFWHYHFRYFFGIPYKTQIFLIIFNKNIPHTIWINSLEQQFVWITFYICDIQIYPSYISISEFFRGLVTSFQHLKIISLECQNSSGGLLLVFIISLECQNSSRGLLLVFIISIFH